MMHRPQLVLVTGVPAGGKTTLAHRLGRALSLPVLSRDAIKALLADSIDAPSAAIARGQFPVFYGLLHHFLRSGISVIGESALDPDRAVNELRPILEHARCVVLHCTTAPGVNVRRFIDRHARGERHPVHPDAEHIARLEAGERPWEVYDQPPALGVPTLLVDTTDGYAPSFEEILGFIRTSALPPIGRVNRLQRGRRSG